MGLWIYQIAILRNKDIEFYREMTQKKEIASSNDPAPTNQERKQVRKDIWFSQDDSSRLHYQIASEQSQLTLSPMKNKFEIIEALQDIKCWMQDKLFTEEEQPMQQTRYIEADTGLYRYTTQEFTANGVTLSLFQLPGHLLPDQPKEDSDAFLRGVAHDISFTLGGKTPQFQAQQFQVEVMKEE